MARSAARSSARSSARPHKWLRRLGYLLLTGILLLGIGLISAYFVYRHYVVDAPAPELERSEIMRRISEESPVFYRDGSHKMGVFFGAEHRQYVKYSDLPEMYVKALTSSEDARFFSHRGLDLMGISRAMVSNIKARRVVAGGSTITQQTIKNLFYRNERTFEAKLKELVLALKLEQLYSKEDILEFYANQFHVHSNGRGFGIASRYFFDKEVKQLNILECAFLAGVVKGPFRYNPFVGNTEEARAAARERARRRTHYVLGRMHEHGHLSDDEYLALKEETLVFKEGDFRYDHSVVLDYVYSALQQEPFPSLFEQHRIDDPATAGISIITTVDREYQQAVEYGLRHNLTEVGALLEGVTLEDFMQPPRRLELLKQEDVFPYAFLPGKIVEPITEGKDAPGLRIDLGGIEGIVPPEGIQRLGDLLKQAEGKNRRSVSSRKDRLALIGEFPVDRNVWVSVKQLRADGTPEVDLEATTELQGALVVLEQGRIRGMVGGQDNRNFNRATTARRQFGSTFKPLTFAAALSLGWGALSPLDNRRQGFPFQNQWYWPRPDHPGVQPFMSMAYAGASSENLTAVSLLYHLTDLLSEDQLVDLADRVGMAPKANEAPEAYAMRIRDRYGILPTDQSLEEGLYEALKAETKVELAFSGKSQEATELTWLPFGHGFDAELVATEKARLPADERAVRTRFLSRHFRQLEALAPQALAAAELLTRGAKGAEIERPSGITGLIQSAFGMAPGPVPAPEAVAQSNPEELERALRRFYIFDERGTQRLAYSEAPDAEWRRATLAEVRALLSHGAAVGLSNPATIPGVSEEALEARQKQEEGATGGILEPLVPDFRPSLPPVVASKKVEELILLEGVLSPATVKELRETLNARLVEARAWDKFSLKRLAHHRDFRIMTGLQYVIQLAQAAGVRSPMKPVLSMTLGSNDITLLEAAMVYQSLLEGKAYAFHGAGPDTGIIERILAPSGEVIYERAPQEHAMLAPAIGASVGRILREVVTEGTGRRAVSAVRVASPDPELDRQLARNKILIPVMGKTGTTNDYLNVAFIGFLPKTEPAQVPLPYGQALTIAAYVGYDDNRPMKRGSIRVQGSSGAMPAWLDAAQGIVQDLDMGRSLNLTELKPGQAIPLSWPTDMAPVMVDKITGLRSGVGLASVDQALPEGMSAYEIYGTPVEGGFREREAYQPFTPWQPTSASGQPTGTSGL